MIRKLALILLLVLGGCDAPQQNWSAPDTNDITNSVYVQGRDQAWTSSNVIYNPNYEYTVTVKVRAPGFNINAPINKATTNGTIRFRSWDECPGCNAINGVSSLDNNGAVEYTLSPTRPRVEAGTLINTLTQDKYLTATIKADSQAEPNSYIWFRVKTASGISGQYEILITAPEPNTSFLGRVTDFTIKPIQTQVQSVASAFWTNLAGNQVTKNIINVMLILYIVILGIYFIFGSIEMTQKELISRIIKIGIVYALVCTNSSWDFFNNNVFKLFTDGQTYLINAVVAPKPGDTSISSLNTVNYDNAFGFINGIFTTIFSSQFLTVLVSFILWFPIGWIGFCLLLLGIIEYTIAIVEALIFYLIATTTVQFLICLGPIFISLILFEKTRGFFETWIKLIISFVMQPIVMFAAIILITALIGGSINELMNIPLGWTCVVPLYINFGGGVKVSLGCIQWYTTTTEKLLEVITTCLVFYLLIRLLTKVTSLSQKITDKLFGQKDASKAATDMAASAGKGIRDSLETEKKESPDNKKQARAAIDTGNTEATAKLEPERGASSSANDLTVAAATKGKAETTTADTPRSTEPASKRDAPVTKSPGTSE